MGDEGMGGLGAELIDDWLTVERLVTCIVSKIVPPVPVEAGVAVKEASKDLLVHTGRGPEREKPPCDVMDMPLRLSMLISAEEDAGRTARLKVWLPPGGIWPLEPLLQEPLPCWTEYVTKFTSKFFMHQPEGGMTAALTVYLAVSNVKVISLISFDALLLVMVTGIRALTSCMTTSVPEATVAVNVSANTEVDVRAHIRAKNILMIFSISMGFCSTL